MLWISQPFTSSALHVYFLLPSHQNPHVSPSWPQFQYLRQRSNRRRQRPQQLPTGTSFTVFLRIEVAPIRSRIKAWIFYRKSPLRRIALHWATPNIGREITTEKTYKKYCNLCIFLDYKRPILTFFDLPLNFVDQSRRNYKIVIKRTCDWAMVPEN